MKTMIFILKGVVIALVAIFLFLGAAMGANNFLKDKPLESTVDVEGYILTMLMEEVEQFLIDRFKSLEEERQLLIQRMMSNLSARELADVQKRLREIEVESAVTLRELDESEQRRLSIEERIRTESFRIAMLEQEKNELKQILESENADRIRYINELKNIIRGSRPGDTAFSRRIETNFTFDNGRTLIKELAEEIPKQEQLYRDLELTYYNYRQEKEQEIINIINEKNREILSLNQTINNLNNEIRTLNGTIASKDTEINRLNNNITELNRQKSQTEVQNQTLNAQIVNLNNSIAANLAEIERVNREKQRLISEIESKQASITSVEREQLRLQNHKRALFSYLTINGYFVSYEGRLEMVLYPGKESEILSTGTFMVYNRNNEVSSKIQIQEQNGQYSFIKFPGFDTPKEGDWF